MIIRIDKIMAFLKIYCHCSLLDIESEVEWAEGSLKCRLVASFKYELIGGLLTFFFTKLAEITNFVFVHYALLDAYGNHVSN